LAGLLAFVIAHSAQAQPASYAELANRVFVRTAPNGFIDAARLLADGRVEGPTYKTNRADYTRAGVGPDQAVLTLSSTDQFGATPFWITNRYRLTFATPTRGTYALDVTLSSVPGTQQFAGPFELSAGPNIAPRLWQDLADLNVTAGNSPTLSVGVAGFELAYQWFKGGAPLAGANQRTLALGPIGATNVGDYRVTVSNPLGSITSAVATVALLNPPMISAQPLPARVLEGDSVTFNVAVTGAELNYEWFFNGLRSGRANAPTITLTNVTATQAGVWSVAIQNNAGQVLSAPARLEVCAVALDSTFNGRPWIKLFATEDPLPGTANRLGPFKTPFEPTFTLWNQTVHATARADDNLADKPTFQTTLLRWRDGVVTPLVFTNDAVPGGQPGENFSYPFYPTDEGDGAVNFAFHEMYERRNGLLTAVITTNTPAPGRPGVTFSGPGSFARRGDGVVISATLRQADGSGAGAGVYLRRGTTLTRLADNTTDLPGVMTGYGGRLTEDSVNFDGATVVFSTMEGLAGQGGVYRATPEVEVTKLLDSGDTLPGLTNAVMTFGDVDVEGGLVFAVVGIRVSVSTQNRIVAFEADGTARVLGNGDFLVAGGPRQVYFGNSGSVTRWTDGITEVVANTGSVIDCRRVKRFFDVEAQGNDVTVGVEFQDGLIGVYGCFGEATTGAPRLLAQPRPVTGPATVPAVFSVAATGEGPLAYQWRHAGQPVMGATQSVFTVYSPAAKDLGHYDVVLSNARGSVTSAPALLTLTAAPTRPLGFGILPAAVVTVPIGGSTTLSVIAAGTGPLTYQWRKARLPLADATGSALTLNQVTTNEHGAYDVVVGNAAGAVTNAVSVSVVPILTQSPTSVSVAAGGTARFSVAATGFTQYRYTWLKEGVTLAGQTNSVLEFTNAQPVNSGNYVALVSGIGGGSVRAAPVALTVTTGGNPEPGPITLAQFAAAGGALQFSLPTVKGVSYRVEQAENINLPVWTPVQTFAGDGATKTVSVPVSGASAWVRVTAP
jgi:hypothetical protein